MKTKISFLFIITTFILILSSCFSDWKGDEGTFTVSINDPTGSYNLSDDLITSAVYKITVSGGPGQDQTATVPPGEQTVSLIVTPGLWNIYVKAYTNPNPNPARPVEELNYNEKTYYLFAAGYEENVDIKPGMNNPVSIKMYKSP